MEPKFYSIEDLMRIFGVKSRKTIYDWMNAGKLQWTQIGGRRKFTQAQIDAFIASGQRPTQDNTTPHLVTA
jgi:excisionase family DNA binding protein